MLFCKRDHCDKLRSLLWTSISWSHFKYRRISFTNKDADESRISGLVHSVHYLRLLRVCCRCKESVRVWNWRSHQLVSVWIILIVGPIVYRPLFVCRCLSVRPSIRPSVRPTVCPSIHPSIHQSIRGVYFNKGAVKNGAFIRARLKRASDK